MSVAGASPLPLNSPLPRLLVPLTSPSYLSLTSSPRTSDLSLVPLPYLVSSPSYLVPLTSPSYLPVVRWALQEEVLSDKPHNAGELTIGGFVAMHVQEPNLPPHYKRGTFVGRSEQGDGYTVTTEDGKTQDVPFDKLRLPRCGSPPPAASADGPNPSPPTRTHAPHPPKRPPHLLNHTHHAIGCAHHAIGFAVPCSTLCHAGATTPPSPSLVAPLTPHVLLAHHPTALHPTSHNHLPLIPQRSTPHLTTLYPSRRAASETVTTGLEVYALFADWRPGTVDGLADLSSVGDRYATVRWPLSSIRALRLWHQLRPLRPLRPR